MISDFLKNCFEDSPAFLQQFLHGASLPIQVSNDVKIHNRKGIGNLELLLTEIKRFIDYYNLKPDEDDEKFSDSEWYSY